ncbi:MAG: phosphonate C-P lyase system protein PhnH [Opitutales bacterium]
MTTLREIDYDVVHDAQNHFRAILDAMARPGEIRVLEPVSIDPPPGLPSASALVALALINRDVAFHLGFEDEAVEAYLKLNTGSPPAALEEADFIFAPGDAHPAVVESAKEGILTYPETAATLVFHVGGLGDLAGPDAARWRLTGPGIPESRELVVAGLNPALVAALQEKNDEFPLGADAILTHSDPVSGRWSVVGLPRTTQAEPCQPF